MIRLRTFVITPEDVFYIVDIATLSAHILGKEPAQHDVSPLKLACNDIMNCANDFPPVTSVERFWQLV